MKIREIMFTVETYEEDEDKVLNEFRKENYYILSKVTSPKLLAEVSIDFDYSEGGKSIYNVTVPCADYSEDDY